MGERSDNPLPVDIAAEGISPALSTGKSTELTLAPSLLDPPPVARELRCIPAPRRRRAPSRKPIEHERPVGPMPPAIETRYAGCRFRSRIEARWAIALDALALDWQYEDHGVHLPDGTLYLPDFYLPELGMWVEVKGHMTPEDEHKIVGLARLDPSRLILVVPSVPHPRSFKSYISIVDGNEGVTQGALWRSDAEGWFLRRFSATQPLPETPRSAVSPSLWEPSEDDARSKLQADVLKAFVKARSARFEFGEGDNF